MVAYRPIDEVIDFIASSPEPQKILDFRPSSYFQDRVNELVEKKKESYLSDDEDKEIERYLLVEHMMRMAKKQAKKRVGLL